jgi:hypothetical protein
MIDFFENINNYTSFERKKKLSELTNGFDLNLLTEFCNEFVEYCFTKFNDINCSMPYRKPIETKDDEICLADFHFPFYEFIQNEVQKEINIKRFDNISFEQIVEFAKTTDFLDEIETIIENQRIKIIDVTQIAQPIKGDAVYKNQNLFKVGLLFANGIMNKYFTVNTKNATVMNVEYTAPKIARELGNESYNKYILASINNYTDRENRNKNIFNSSDMMTKISSHCDAENIPIDDYFKSRLNIE